MVNATGASFPNHIVPYGLFRADVFPFPFYRCLIAWRVRSLLEYFLLYWSSVLKTSIQTKMVLFRRLFFLNRNLIKSVQGCIERTMSPWSWPCSFSLAKRLSLFLVLLNPEFVVSFVEMGFGWDGMGAMVPWPRDSIAELLSIHIKEKFLTFGYLPLFELSNLLIFLFDRFLQAIGTNSWRFSVLLFHLNPL